MAKCKLNDELIEKITKAVAMGLTNNAVCDYVGINEATFYSYMNQGTEDCEKGKETQFSKFLKSYKRAKADFRIFHMAKIRQAAETGSWQASAWCLERCCPDEYGANKNVKLTLEDEEEKQITIVQTVYDSLENRKVEGFNDETDTNGQAS